ncbi:MAG: patatin-like phospholipase family protein [Candidatus Paracaedibacteraceae bacterium]|nr:patatin-like phospholipase family protein [Candidatus Paracaedibacteraceae bacterium]
MTSKQQSEQASKKKRVALALQGGGAHGAFTWGVLDRLLEDNRLEFEGVTGTSAGGMNAVCLAQGLARGGSDAAREDLRKFWTAISASGKNSALNNRGPVDKAMGNYTMYNSPGFMIFDYLSRIFSPYELNPMKKDPLKDVISNFFDFELIREQKECKVYLCATHVYTGKLRIFTTKEMRVETLLATACLPTIHSAVMVGKDYYWDGGFIGNPVFFPLIYDCDTPDIVLIQLNPNVRNRLPVTSREIADRLNEITNNASVVREMRAISYITDMIDKGELDQTKHKRLRMHVIEDESVFQDLGWSSKLNTEWEFLTHLFEKGRAAGDAWLKENFDSIGVRTTAQLNNHLMGDG